MSDLIPHEHARTLTKDEYEAWVNEAAADEQEIKAGLKDARYGLWRAAEALYRFTEHTAWLALGYETIGEWLADPDITLTRATYYRMVDAWREYAVVREVDVSTLRLLDLTKAAIAIPALKAGKATTEDVVSDVEVLGARDLREKYTYLRQEYEVLEGDGSTVDGDEGHEEADPLAAEPPIMVVEEDELYVRRRVADELVVVLQQVLSELGNPERKAMSKQLRSNVIDVLELAYTEEGLGATT